MPENSIVDIDRLLEMKNIKINYFFFPCRICLLMFITILILSNNDVFAQKKSRKKQPDLDVRFKLATIYDDNILKYSEKYLKRFRNREDEDRFHIDTYDDLILLTSLQLTSTFRVFGKLKTKINGEAGRRTYMVNNIKSWNYISMGLRQYLPKRTGIKFLYSYIPNFYVRHFRDEQWINVYGYEPVTFKPYAFSKENYGLWVQKSFLKNTRVKLSLYYSRYFHNEHFTEYDSKNMSYGIQLYQPIHKNIKLQANYRFITSDAKGYDKSVETLETTNGPDASYEEDKFSFGFSWRLPRLLKLNNTLSAKYTVQNRYYSSLHPLEIDLLHAGRVDKNIRLYFNYRIKLNKYMQLSAYYKWYGRDTETLARENKLYVSNEKDYRQNVIGFEFIYNLKL